MLEYIKKVAAAGRGGDTKLAYLSSSARQLLKDLGGAGTKNPKTKLPEYRRRRFLEEGEFMEPSAGAPPAAPAFQPPPVMPEPPAAMTPIASEPPQAPPMDPRDFTRTAAHVLWHAAPGSAYAACGSGSAPGSP
jgi:hypothetical protein